MAHDDPAELVLFQSETAEWLSEVFPPEISDNIRQRAQRFLEEALELFQSLDMTKTDALILVDYVFSRNKGEASQEVGGVMVTLAALCHKCAEKYGTNLENDAWRELSRIQSPEIIEKIRKKQNAKNRELGISDVGIKD